MTLRDNQDAKTLARGRRRRDASPAPRHHDSHPDCRAQITQIVALHSDFRRIEWTPATQWQPYRQLTAHSSQLTAHSSQLTAHSSQLTAHSSQLTAHSSQLTAHSSQLTPPRHRSAVVVLAAYQLEPAAGDPVGASLPRADGPPALEACRKRRISSPGSAQPSRFRQCTSAMRPRRTSDRADLAALRQHVQHALFLSGNVHDRVHSRMD